MKCSIATCGICKNQNRPNLTFHRLPRNEIRKRNWLHAIGQENIRPGTKDIYVCSLHFEESSFNKTLNFLRLKDDAIPTIILKPTQPTSSNNRPVLMDTQNYIEMGSQPSSLNDPHKPIGTENNFEMDLALQELKTLQEKVLQQKKKIKSLNETVRRQKIKLQNFKDIILDLKEKNMISNENSIVLEQFSGPKDRGAGG